MSDNRAQTVTLVLTDGRKHTLTGPVFIEDVDNLDDIGVVRVMIHPPVPLAEGCYWEDVTEPNAKKEAHDANT